MHLCQVGDTRFVTCTLQVEADKDHTGALMATQRDPSISRRAAAFAYIIDMGQGDDSVPMDIYR